MGHDLRKPFGEMHSNGNSTLLCQRDSSFGCSSCPDHEMIAMLLGRFARAITWNATPSEPAMHLDGLSAIMESHFRYEERELLGVLSTLDLDADPQELLGPL